jgi:hypothetical protein
VLGPRQAAESKWWQNEYFNAVAQLVEALRYKPAGRGFDSRWCQSIFH